MWSEDFLAESQDKVEGLIIYSVALRRAFTCLTIPYYLRFYREVCELGGSGQVLRPNLKEGSRIFQSFTFAEVQQIRNRQWTAQ